MPNTHAHTPGPWRWYSQPGDAKGQYADKCRSFTIESDTRKHMFDTQAWKYSDDVDVWDEVEANAALIAAAPELLEALQEFIECGPNAGHNQDLIVMAQAAITKATQQGENKGVQ